MTLKNNYKNFIRTSSFRKVKCRQTYRIETEMSQSLYSVKWRVIKIIRSPPSLR